MCEWVCVLEFITWGLRLKYHGIIFMLKCRHWYYKRSTWQAPLWLSQANKILFRLESQVVYRPRFFLLFRCVMMSWRMMMPLQTIGEKSDTLRTFVCLMEENIVPFYYIIVERKMRFQTRTHIEKISKLNLASNIHHSYVIQHRSHGCARNFPILTFANTSLKRMKFVYTQKQKGILIRAIFGCEKFHAIIIVSLIFGNMFPNQQTIWSNIARTYH